jgi:uncharacterized protein (DUF488 family)
MQELFTIGHSTHEPGEFVRLLRLHVITAVGDVRSSPFSQRLPQFNRPVLETLLKKEAIRYVFLGDELGARRSERECYVDGQARYELIARTTAFAEGIRRVLEGMQKFRLTLMCTEKDPLTCHRTILVCRELRQCGVKISHILADGSLEPHEALEERLRAEMKLNQPSLFETAEELLQQAYAKQGLRIAYRQGDVEDAERESMSL